MSEEVKNSEVQEEQKLQAVQDVDATQPDNVEEPQQTTPQTVETFGQALHVLIQAADLGRQKGIYDWDSLSLISQSMKIVGNVINSNKQQNEQ